MNKIWEEIGEVSSGIITPKLGGHSVQVREETPLVDSRQVQLVAQGGDLSGRNDEFGERVGKPVLSQEVVEGAEVSEQRVKVAD